MRPDSKEIDSFLAGLTARAQLVTMPFRAYAVKVDHCSGDGDCTEVCPVHVFTQDASKRCTVTNEELCIGCMACVAQCLDNGVAVKERQSSRHPSLLDLMR